MKNLDQPVGLALDCSERLVNWKIPIKVDSISPEIINVDRYIKLDGGTFRIISLELGSASTSLNYEFIPSVGNNETTDITPVISMVANGVKYDAETGKEGLSGKAVFKVPVNRSSLSNTAFNMFIINKTVKLGESITLENGKMPLSYDLQGAELKVQKMEVKDGNTYIDLIVDDTNRKFHDFNLSINTGEKHTTCSIGNSVEFNDKDVESRLKKDPYSITPSDVTNTTIKKSIKIDGEHKKVYFTLNS